MSVLNLEQNTDEEELLRLESEARRRLESARATQAVRRDLWKLMGKELPLEDWERD